MRKELSILVALKHEHIVPLVGISTHPMCLILSLAPLGALSSRLAEFKRKGVRLPVDVVTEVVLQVGLEVFAFYCVFFVHLNALQVSGALVYLHANKIIYRDLKGENVLVWRLPLPEESATKFDSHFDDVMLQTATPPSEVAGACVHVKLADYGVSRSVLPSGTKGLAGTPAFMAPEIVQHKGEEVYTEKVDCYSFGMFLYELLTQSAPFERDVMSSSFSRFNRDSYIVEGGRPALTTPERVYPAALLDVMASCWSAEPSSRPSASQILALASQPQFSQLCEAVTLSPSQQVLALVCAPHHEPAASDDAADGLDDIIEEEDVLTSPSDVIESCDVWMSVCDQKKSHISILSIDKHGVRSCKVRILISVHMKA